MIDLKSDKFLTIAMLVSMCIWGTSWSSAKVLSEYGTPISIAFIRFCFTSIALLVLLKSFGISLKIKTKGILPLLAAGLFMAAYGFIFFSGLQLGMAGAAGVLVTTVNPLFAYIIGVIIHKKTPPRKELLGLGIGIIAGAVLLQVWLKFDLLIASGNLYFVAAGLVWAIMSKFSSSSQKHGSPFAFSLWMHLVCVSFLSPIINYDEVITILTSGDQKFWANILYFSIINSAGATTCFIYATARLGAEKASGFVFMVPCSAALTSWLFLDEVLTLTTITGGLLGVIAVLTMQGKLKKSAH